MSEELGVENVTYEMVNSPKHYQIFPDQEAYEVIKASLTAEEWKGYCKGNFLKYRLRAGEKDALQQDIDKSNWYRSKLYEEEGVSNLPHSG